MERLGIVSFYDGEGVVDGSVEYYIKSLRDVVSEIIVVVNGKISNIGQIQLNYIADECIIRQNTGFDAGAYKEVLCRQNFVQKMKEYDEIVLCNDTCFGPFKSFSGIFAEMEHKKVDFWGLDFVENKVADYLQSYFLVFRPKTYFSLIEYFHGYINEYELEINNIYAQFEVGLYYYLKRHGYKPGYYRKSNLEVYQSPNFGLADSGLPIMKKKCFDERKYNHDNCIGALKYICQNYDYDMNLIMETIQRKYKIVYNLEKEFSLDLVEKKYPLWIADIDYETIKNFCLEHKDIYIYGCGIIARKLFWIYRLYIEQFRGFIVSDGERKGESLYHYPVFNLSEVDNQEIYILVALNKENTYAVKAYLSAYTNCLFLFKSI